MKTRNIIDLALLFILGIFMVVKLGRFGGIIGFLIIAADIIIILVLLKGEGVIKTRREKQKEKEAAEERKKVKELRKYDEDSGLGYCSHCGNYSVKDNRCEVCGEKVTE